MPRSVLKIFLGLLPALATVLSNAPAAAQIDGSIRYTLDNGAEVIITPIEGVGQVAVIAAYGVGFFDDPAGHPQLAHLVEHLRVTAATPQSEPTKRRAELSAIGAVNAETQPHFTYYDYLLPADALELALRTEAERLDGLSPTIIDIGREGPLAAQEASWTASHRTPRTHKFALMAAAQAWRHDATHVDVATGLQNTRIDVAETFRKRWYTTDRLRLYITGSLDINAAKKAIDESIGKLPAPKAQKPDPDRAIDWAALPRRTTITWDLAVPTVVVAAPPPDDPAIRFALTRALQHMSTRSSFVGTPVLGTSAMWPVGELPPMFIAPVAVDRNVDGVLEHMVRTLVRLSDGELTDAEYASLRNAATTPFPPPLTPQMVEQQARQLAQMMSLAPDDARMRVYTQALLNRMVVSYDPADEQARATVASWTKDQWASALAEHLSPAKLYALVVEPRVR